jgi:hypothetical protein
MPTIDGESEPEDDLLTPFETQSQLSTPRPAMPPVTQADVYIAWSEIRDRDMDYKYCYFEFSCTALIDIISAAEIPPVGSKRDDDVISEWRSSLLLLFMSIPEPVLLSVLDGSLCRKDLGGTDNVIHRLFTAEEDNYWLAHAQNEFSPVIYIRQLADDTGNSPTPLQLDIITQALAGYALGDVDVALALDNSVISGTSSIEDIQSGRHFYLAGQTARALVLITWCNAILKLCEAVPKKDRHLPLPHALTYCGYTKQLGLRGKQYAKNQSTTWLVLLVQAAFRLYYPSQFNFYMYPIAFIAAEEEASLGERALTCCTYSNYRYGGFCVWPAGSVSSIKLPGQSDNKRALTWDVLRQWREVENGKVYDANRIREKGKLQVFKQRPTTEELMDQAIARSDATIASVKKVLARSMVVMRRVQAKLDAI